MSNKLSRDEVLQRLKDLRDVKPSSAITELAGAAVELIEELQADLEDVLRLNDEGLTSDRHTSGNDQSLLGTC